MEPGPRYLLQQSAFGPKHLHKLTRRNPKHLNHCWGDGNADCDICHDNCVTTESSRQWYYPELRQVLHDTTSAYPVLLSCISVKSSFKQGDYCQLVALNQTISLSLFESINPQINSTCGNLLAGYYYCVSPTSSWNATSTVVQAPTSTPQGTTADCYAYYTIQSGGTLQHPHNKQKLLR